MKLEMKIGNLFTHKYKIGKFEIHTGTRRRSAALAIGYSSYNYIASSKMQWSKLEETIIHQVHLQIFRFVTIIEWEKTKDYKRTW